MLRKSESSVQFLKHSHWIEINNFFSLLLSLIDSQKLNCRELNCRRLNCREAKLSRGSIVAGSIVAALLSGLNCRELNCRVTKFKGGRRRPKSAVESSGTLEICNWAWETDEEMSRKHRKECDQIFRTEARILSVLWERMICLWNSELRRLPFC